jgi:hypothetical protein
MAFGILGTQRDTPTRSGASMPMPVTKKTPSAKFPQPPQGDAMAEAIRILCSNRIVGPRRAGKDPLVSEEDKRSIESKIERILERFRRHSRLLGNAPRVKGARLKLKALSKAAKAMKESIAKMDEFTVAILHEPLGPLGAIEVTHIHAPIEECNGTDADDVENRIDVEDFNNIENSKGIQFRFPGPALHPAVLYHELYKFEKWLEQIEKYAFDGAKALEKQDKGGGTDLGIQAFGAELTRLTMDCAALLEEYGVPYSYSPSPGNTLYNLVQVIRELLGHKKVVGVAEAFDLLSQSSKALPKMDEGITEMMQGFDGPQFHVSELGIVEVSSESSEPFSFDGDPNDLIPQSSEALSTLLNAGQVRTRTQLGAMPNELRRKRKKKGSAE